MQHIFNELVPAYELEHRNFAKLFTFHLTPVILEFICVFGAFSPFLVVLNAVLLTKELTHRLKTVGIVCQAVFGTRESRGSFTLLLTTLVILLLVCVLLAVIVLIYFPKDFYDESQVCVDYWSEFALNLYQ